MDFGVLKAIRNCLLQSEKAQELGVKQVYLSPPKSQDFPIIFLEIEEIWTSMVPLPGNAFAKIKFKASSFSHGEKGKQSLNIATTLRHEIDGTIMDLEEGKKGTSRFINSVIELPHPNRPSSIEQYFDVLVRDV